MWPLKHSLFRDFNNEYSNLFLFRRDCVYYLSIDKHFRFCDNMERGFRGSLLERLFEKI